MHNFSSLVDHAAPCLSSHPNPFHPTEQDRGLEALSQALRRQQNMGLAIQEEVVTHNG